MEKAVKSCDSARKKYEDAKKKVDDRGDKATQKMRDTREHRQEACGGEGAS